MRTPIYIATFFLGLHYYLIIYINSSYLTGFVSESAVNVLYAVGAVLNILVFFLSPYILSKIKARSFLSILLLLEFAAIISLSLVTTALGAIFFFVLSQAVAPILIYCLDLYLESSLKTEESTGWMRGLFITALNTALIISLFTVTLVAKQETFPLFYMLSALVLIPIILIVASKFKSTIHATSSSSFSLSGVVFFLSADKDVLRILITHLLLHLFYAIMVIYLPLLLLTVPNFAWGEVGAIMLIMILPFLLLELPLGRLMDRRSGETEILRAGFIILALSTIALALITAKIYWLWAGILFVTRIGASFVEISNESYFFKKVTDRNPNIISLFRGTQSFAIVISPLLALPLLAYFGYSTLFFALGLTMFLGLFFIPKVDTR
jgi:hypothetical protein